MAETVTELWRSRASEEGENPSVEFVAKVEGTDDDTLATEALRNAFAATYRGLQKVSSAVQRIGETAWIGTVRYGRKKPPEIGDSVFEFDTTGGTAHITQSIRTSGRYAPPGQVIPQTGGTIGITSDGPEGVDIVTPAFAWSERHYIAADLVTTAYIRTLKQLTGAVNLDDFRDHAPGEVLFKGATGTLSESDGWWEMTFKFMATDNAVGLTAGDIQGISKLGHEYLWFLYEEADDEDAAVLIHKPIAAYVEQVQQYAPFALLGI